MSAISAVNWYIFIQITDRETEKTEDHISCKATPYFIMGNISHILSVCGWRLGINKPESFIKTKEIRILQKAHIEFMFIYIK